MPEKIVFDEPFDFGTVAGHFYVQEFHNSEGATFDRKDWKIEVALVPRHEAFKAGDIVYLTCGRHTVYNIYHIEGDFAWLQDTAKNFPPATVSLVDLRRAPSTT